MEPISAIRERIAAKRQELQSVQRRADVLQAEVRTWEEALALIAGNSVQASPEASAPQPRTASVGGRRKRKLTEHWRKLLSTMVTDPSQREWPLDDMETLSEVLGDPIQRNTLRSQMSIYADRGYVRRVREGVYEVTQLGAEEAGVPMPTQIADVQADAGSAGDLRAVDEPAQEDDGNTAADASVASAA